MLDKKEVTMCIPLEKLPPCWNDEARMNVLFAPFRSRNANPQDWDSKLAFWRNMVELYCKESRNYKFTLPELLKVFNRNGRSPGCLEDVINEMFKLKEIKPVGEYLEETPSKSWTGWATQVLVKKPFKWTFQTVKNSFVERDKNQEYVHLCSVEIASKTVLKSIPENYKGKVIDMHHLLDVLEWPIEKANGLQLVLHKLLCEGKADIKEIGGPSDDPEKCLTLQLIKINTKIVKPISDIDVSIHILEENERILTKNIEKQESEVNKIIEQAKNCLKTGHRQMAKGLLRKKKELEKQLDKKFNALHNVHILLSRVKEVDDDAEILSSYKLALSSLQNTFKTTGLTEDVVADTMISLGDVLDIHEDIQAALSQPIKDENCSELEEELAELLAVDTRKEEEANKKEKPQEDTVEKLTKEVKKASEYALETVELEERLQNLKLPAVPTNDPNQDKNKLSI